MLNYEDRTVPSPDAVLELLENFRRSKIMFAAVSLGIFDSLDGGPATAEMLATRLSCNPSAMARLLDACVGLGLLSKREGRYENTPAATVYLTSSSPQRLTGYINYSNDVMWKMWGNLEGAIREGTHRWKETYGWDEPIFSSLFKDDRARHEFLMGMHGFGRITSPVLVGAVDLSGFGHLVDLGGATGHWAIAACERYPHLRATVFDLPAVLPLTREIVAACPAADRIDTVGGDFFESDLPPGDLYALGRILHDWDEAKIRRLLAKIHAALPVGGAVMVGEKLLYEEKDGPRWAQLQDVNMLIVTEGRERTLSEYAALLEEAGFSRVVGCRTGVPLDVVLAYKPDPSAATR